MDNKSDEQLIIMQATIDTNRQDYDEKMKKQDNKIYSITALIGKIMDKIRI